MSKNRYFHFIPFFAIFQQFLRFFNTLFHKTQDVVQQIENATTYCVLINQNSGNCNDKNVNSEASIIIFEDVFYKKPCKKKANTLYPLNRQAYHHD